MSLTCGPCLSQALSFTYTRAINHVYPLHESNVLPYFCLTRDRRYYAHLLLPQSVDDRRLADVRVANHADRDLLAVVVERAKLSKQCDKRAFTERVVDGGVESYSGSKHTFENPGVMVHT
jgi:hypothetical protein